MTQEIIEARPVGALLPVLDPKAAKAAYQAYLELCQAILLPYDKRIVKDGVVVQESDYARIPTRKKVGDKWITELVDAPKKSAFRKLAKFYGVSTEILEKSRDTRPDGSYTWNYTVKATAGSVTQDCEGCCTSNERQGMSEHDVKATAHTRAKSRAISDLIGFGQVSAEEYSNYEEQPKPVEATAKVVDPTPAAKATPHAEKPLVDSAEETVRATLIANGLDAEHLLIVRYGDVVRIEPQPGLPDKWGEYDRVLKLLKAKWSDEALRWEAPAKDLEHLGTDAPEPGDQVYDIWAVEWKQKGGEPAPRDASWAWAFAYDQDGAPLPEIKDLVQYVEQYGALEAEGYTVTLGGRDKSLLNLKKNKEAQA